MHYPNELMLRVGLACVLSGVLCSSAAGQKVELFGGYQFTHLQPAFNAHGWNASITGNFRHILGITGDFSGAYENHVTAYTYTAGPVLQARFPIIQPFVHGLFGGMTRSNGTSSTAFAMMLGGGIDLGFRKGFGVRIVQADWISTKFNNATQNRNVRGSAGLVIKF